MLTIRRGLIQVWGADAARDTPRFRFLSRIPAPEIQYHQPHFQARNGPRGVMLSLTTEAGLPYVEGENNYFDYTPAELPWID